MEVTPREYTVEEVSQQFLQYIRNITDYWLNESRAPSVEEKMDGLVHSILAMLDGAAGGMPMFAVIPNPHPDDKAYNIANGNNYYPDFNKNGAAVCDISGGLHEMMIRR